CEGRRREMAKPKRDELNQILFGYLNTINDTLQLFDQSPPPTQDKLSWNDVLQMSDHLSKQATIGGSYEKDRKPSVPQLTGAVWEACSNLKKLPATNVKAIGLAMTQVAVSVKDVLREMKEVKEACSSPEHDVSANQESGSLSSDEDDDDDLGDDLSPEELEVAKLVADIVSETLMVIKELIRDITGMIKVENPSDNGGFVDSLEKLLKLCQGIGVEIDELGACVYPPQELSLMKQTVERIKGKIGEIEAVVMGFKSSSSSDGFLRTCTRLQSLIQHTETELDARSEGEVVSKRKNVTL
ncbi:unnamed protein product, partial [Thlaspi arvense]